MTLFGYTQRDLRRRKNVSLQELGEAVGLGTATLENIESGYILPSEAAAKKIAAYFGVTVGYMRGSVEISLEVPDGALPAAGSPERFVKLRPVSVDIFGDGVPMQEGEPVRDIILPLPATDHSTYMAVRWGDNSVTRYRVEAGDILVIREDAFSVRNGDLVLVKTADARTVLRRTFEKAVKSRSEVMRMTCFYPYPFEYVTPIIAFWVW